MIKLTESNEDYLKVIYELDCGNGVRIVDIADKLNVAKSSTCVAVNLLQKKELVERGGGRRVILTTKGKLEAESIVNKFSVIKNFLNKVFNVDEKSADTEACDLEHVVSVETTQAMIEILNFVDVHCRYCQRENCPISSSTF
ncbi:metal-dependent transcriptional regulator [Sinanaerobacter sp. ZZT-01]|uniref:metal-dependent transcriptional regulator n=1 Tax=Sinanaerobacter sp. ZZT-01 TaxID=3111540 RepID=UPI002D775F28|nr:metal-dependent transcriptional regulator [Sinanaerobacter sp. ZZT-01]WRR93807.1 metal-dependent transcriptional regulator [Sinanaerobacter sp. ZZT-01]